MINLLGRYLKGYRIQMILVLIFVLFQAVCQLYLPTMMGDIVDNGVAKGDTRHVMYSGIAMLIVSLVAALCMVASSYYSAYVTASFTCRIRADIFDKVKEFSQTDFDRFGGATLMTRSTNDATQVQIVVINGLRSLLLIPITGVGALIMAFRENNLLTMVLLIAFVFTTIIIVWKTRRSMPLFALKQDRLDRLNLLVKEKLTGVRAIRAFKRQDYENEKFKEANEDSTKTALKANYAVSFFTPFMTLMMNLTVVVILWLGANEVQLKIVQIGGLLVFIQYILLFMSALSLISVLLIAYPGAQVSALRMKEVLDSDIQIKDPVNPVVLTDVKGRLEFENVSFGYGGAEEKVLKNLDFVAEPGKVTAVIGATGSGKSTLVQLAMRLYEVGEGEITIDGINIKDCSQKNLRELISYAPQKSVLFGGTVEENIRFGNQQATKEDVKKSAEMAQILSFIEAREGGFDGTIYQGGKDVSGGQRQRLSIARALLKKAPIVIFDDCFSALDLKTDKLVRKGIAEAMKDVTIIVVAQRISTVVDADKIIILDNGEIVGQGRHEELATNCSVYQEIMKSQAYGENKEAGL